MNKLYVTTMTAAVLGLTLASSAVAQQPTNLPKERTSAGSCADVDWNKDMLVHHPALVDACQEVIIVEGETWARFAAKFVRIDPNGDVIFSVRDKRDRSIEEVTLNPTPGQVAYIEDRATPFSSLRTTDRISLYVPEGQYGFATQPAPKARLAKVVVPADTTRTAATKAPVVTSETALAQRDTRRAVLPATAGPLPWLALVGFLSMLGGLGLTLRRWN